MRHRQLRALLVLLPLVAACSKSDEGTPVATATVTLAAPSVAIESPVDITYTFAVASNAPTLSKDYRVFVHFNDATGQQLWTDDHLPPTPTTEWKPGATIQYTRTMFVPKVPYTGQITMDVGLYVPNSKEPAPLVGKATGGRANRVATLEVTPQVNSTLVLFSGGWHDAELVAESPGVEWRWSKAESTLRFRNPRQDVTFMLDLDQPQSDLSAPQQVQLRAGTTALDSFSLTPGDHVVRRVPISSAALGNDDNVELTLAVVPTFTPAYLPGATSKDVRTLGVRVFHAYIQPK